VVHGSSDNPPKKKIISRFVFNNGELLTATKEEGCLQSRYVLGYGGAASEVNVQAGYHVYHLDEQNSTVYITGRQRQVENTYAYDALGNLRGQAGELLNWTLYTGQQYDQEMGQYYLRARFYNPMIGRFTQEDVYRGDGLNLHDYYANNPVIYYDPSGYKYSVNEILKVLQTDSNGNKYVTNKDYKNAHKTASTSLGNYQGTTSSSSWFTTRMGEI